MLLAFVIVILGILVEGLLVRLPSTLGVSVVGERVGAVHIHTKASDGSGTIPEIMVAAREANLSFMAITDHNVSMPKTALDDDPPDFAVISGEELTTASGHFVTLGIPLGWQKPPTNNAEVLLAATHAAGGFNIIAHPFHTKIPWTDWKTSDYDGIEIWNEDENWRRDNPLNLLITLLLYTVNDQLAMVRFANTPVPNFAKWDELLAQRPMVGMCGMDAHAALRLGHGRILRFPGYVPVFQAAREHVLLGLHAGDGAKGGAEGAGSDAESGDARMANASEILEALKHGHSYCALDAMYPANGFTSRVSSGVSSGGPGDSVPWTGEGRLHISVPAGASQPRIKVIHNGQQIIDREAWTIDEPIPGPGWYRTEVFLRQPGVTGWRRWTLWLFSNPTYVTGNTGGASANAAKH